MQVFSHLKNMHTLHTHMYKHTLAACSPEPQTVKVNNVGRGPSTNYHHLSSAPDPLTAPSCQAHRDTLSSGHAHSVLCPRLQALNSPFHSDLMARMLLDVCHGGGRPVSTSPLLLSQELCGLISDQNNSLFLILPSSSSNSICIFHLLHVGNPSIPHSEPSSM